jgi:pyroglutamyl-peptidase
VTAGAKGQRTGARFHAILRAGGAASRAAACESDMSATFLVTGFEPFAEHRTNSSWDALELLRPSWPAAIVARRLPVDHLLAHQELRRALDELRPRAVLCTGLARGEVFRIEQRARRPAALAAQPGAAESWGRWPWDELRRALDDAAVRSRDSFDAGQYVCESTYWSLLNYPQDDPQEQPERQLPAQAPEFAAFLHVPPESALCPLETIARAVGSVVQRRWAELSIPRRLNEEIG